MLCGATFFRALIDAAVPQLNSKEKWQGKTNAITQPKMFSTLVLIADPHISSNFDNESFYKTVSKYKNCKINESRMYFPLCTDPFINSFKSRMKNEQHEMHTEMIAFISRFLDYKNKAKIDCLIKTIIGLIRDDPNAIQRLTMIANKKDIELGLFLLDIWFYIVMYANNNKSGKDTIDQWENLVKKYSQITIDDLTFRIEECANIDDVNIDDIENKFNEGFNSASDEDMKPKTEHNKPSIVINNLGNNCTNITNNAFMSINIGGTIG